MKLLRLLTTALVTLMCLQVGVEATPATPPTTAMKLAQAITEYTRASREATGVPRVELLHALAALQRLAIPKTIDASRRLACNQPGVFTAPAVWEVAADTIVTCPRIVLVDHAKLRIRNAAALLLDGDQIVVGSYVDVDASGTPGETGARGVSIPGEWISGSDAAYWAALNDCRSRASHPDRGGKGGKGVKGGDGGYLVVSVAPQTQLKPNVAGGKGGPGGPGGSGRLLKNSRNYYCNGCTMNCPSNGDGDRGDDGVSGRYILVE